MHKLISFCIHNVQVDYRQAEVITSQIVDMSICTYNVQAECKQVEMVKLGCLGLLSSIMIH
jgi:hypothetical protein